MFLPLVLPPSGWSIALRFAEKHSNIDLRVSATLHHVDFAREDVDLAVHHGDDNWPGLEVVRLSGEQLFPVCSPKLLVGRAPTDKTGRRSFRSSTSTIAKIGPDGWRRPALMAPNSPTARCSIA